MPLPMTRKSAESRTGCYPTIRVCGSPAARVHDACHPSSTSAPRAGAYRVVVGARRAHALARAARPAPASAPRRIVVSSQRVWDRAGRARSARVDARRSSCADGERSRRSRTVARVYDALLKAQRRSRHRRSSRSAAASSATWSASPPPPTCAASALVHVPTTLLAQVDSAIGGKVGVNHPLGKNLIGAFHRRAGRGRSDVLATLPRREFRAGLYEVIKYGVIAERDAARSCSRLARRRCSRSAATVLRRRRRRRAASRPRSSSADERERGLRRILNFGHTVGHALEAATSYRRFRHGEAVALGHARGAGARRGARRHARRRSPTRVAALIAQLGPLPSVADLRRGRRRRRDRPRQEGRRTARCTSSLATARRRDHDADRRDAKSAS